MDTRDRRDLGRRRQIVDYGVEQFLHSLVFERCAADDRNEVIRECCLADRRLNLFGGDILSRTVFLKKILIDLGGRFDHFRAVAFGVGEHVFGDGFGPHVLAQIVIVDVRDHVDEIDYPLEAVFFAYRQLNRDRVGSEPVLHHRDNTVKIRTGNVHFVDIGYSRDVVLVGLSPDRLGLGLDPALGAENGYRAVQYSE